MEDKKEGLERVLLHSCCGPCSTAVLERLSEEFMVDIFFYNPCITDNEEYQKRKNEQIKFIEKFNEKISNDNIIKFYEGSYEPEEFFRITRGMEDEPEGGKRCRSCFIQRLAETAKEAVKNEYDYFATTLTVSPHKNYQLISKIGKDLEDKEKIIFLDRDFKKKDGYKRSIELSKKYDLYRQNYCGCEFSKR